MKIYTRDIPQADRLEDVIKAVEAVYNGATTELEIGNYIKKGERQGRYYRQGAELLGWLRNERNNASMTELGRKFLTASKEERHEILLASIVNDALFQAIIGFFKANSDGITSLQLRAFMKEISGAKDAIVVRRSTTILSWLQYAELIHIEDHKYILVPNGLDKVPTIGFDDTSEPLMPKTNELKEYTITETRIKKAAQIVAYMRDEAKLERANNAHRNLVNLVAHRITNAGSSPRYNDLIDLAAQANNRQYIFEMKSVEKNNFRSQIRAGLSQLYEYRYLQNLPEAHLVLVIEKPLPDGITWMGDYLETDRNIRLLWDGDNELHATEKTREELGFLWSN